MLKAWEETLAGGGGKPLRAEDLRRVLVKQGAKFSALIFVQIFLDLGAAYGAYVGGKQHWLAGGSGCPVLYWLPGARAPCALPCTLNSPALACHTLPAGTFLGAGQEQYGGLAVALQAGAFFVSGYYGFGAFLDVFRLLTVLTATYQFNVNAGVGLLSLAGWRSGRLRACGSQAH